MWRLHANTSSETSHHIYTSYDMKGAWDAEAMRHNSHMTYHKARPTQHRWWLCACTQLRAGWGPQHHGGAFAPLHIQLPRAVSSWAVHVAVQRVARPAAESACLVGTHGCLRPPRMLPLSQLAEASSTQRCGTVAWHAMQARTLHYMDVV